MTFAASSSERSVALPRGRRFRFGRTPLVMGILNVTPDSFSDAGAHAAPHDALSAAMRMIEDGAAVVDVGGESTRPGSTEVSAADEIGRIVPVIARLRAATDVVISVDTRKAVVAEAALDAGADLVNDVSAMRFDESMAPLVARRGVPVIAMHMRGTPATMQQLTQYGDVVADVKRELAASIDAAVARGVDRAQILVDPGIGFAKDAEQNLELLARAAELAELGPLVIGASRKAFVGRLTGRSAGPDRAAGSLAAVAAAFHAGAAVVRVHDVRETADFLAVLTAIAAKEPAR